MIKQNTAAAEHVISFTILPDYPVAVLLGNRIGAVRMEWCFFVLRDLFDFTVQFGGGCLIYPAGIRKSAVSYRLKYS